MANTNPARGMRDFLPSDVRKREYVIGIIKEVYESYGFEPLETPAVENIETLMGKYGEEGNQLIFKILKRGEKLDESLETGEQSGSASGLSSPVSRLSDLALRYDLTVPLARVVANRKNDLPKFFKRYQIQPVWRADRPARGRFREFYQCDVDAIGSKSMTVEAELISAVSEILTRLGFEDFVIRINHRQILMGLLSSVGVPQELHSQALVILDKLDKIGDEAIRTEYLNAGISQGNDLLDSVLPIIGADNSRKIEVLGELLEGNPIAGSGLKDLDQIRQLVNNDVLVIDPTLARGLSYYTGTIMEINVPDLAGSLGGGGRYDELIGMFGKEQMPACGFSLGLERILVVMDERGMFPPEIASNASADVMVTIWNEDSTGESLKLANELRSDGLRVLLYPETDKLGKQLKYASQLNIPWVCVLGESELALKKVTLKNMRSGEQSTIEHDQIYREIKKTSSS